MISIRRATLDDADLLFAWRNDPATRAASISTAEVGRQEHRDWLSRSLSNPHRVLYLASDEQGAPIGMCRFDLAEDARSAEVSINLAPEQRGRGLAGAVLKSAIAELASAGTSNIELSATIRPENLASRRLFESAGFAPNGSAGDGPLLSYRLSL